MKFYRLIKSTEGGIFVDKVEGKLENQQSDYCIKHVLAACYYGCICILKRVKQCGANVLADNGRNTVPHRHEDHKQKYPRLCFPYKSVNIKESVEELFHCLYRFPIRPYQNLPGSVLMPQGWHRYLILQARIQLCHRGSFCQG